MIFSTSWQDAEWQSVELREDTGNINIGRTTVAQEGIKIAVLRYQKACNVHSRRARMVNS